MVEVCEDKKVFVLDTNVLIDDPNCIERFGGVTVVIPAIVLDEIDRIKGPRRESGSRRTAARIASHRLEEYAKRGSLRQGVRTDSGGRLLVDASATDFGDLPTNYEHTNDHIILLVARTWQKKLDPPDLLTFVTNDVPLRLKAKALFDMRAVGHTSDAPSPSRIDREKKTTKMLRRVERKKERRAGKRTLRGLLR